MVPSKLPTGYTPLSTFISVDFPAPFSPQMPCTCPLVTSRDTPSRAFTPLKSFTMLFILRMIECSTTVSWFADGPGTRFPGCPSNGPARSASEPARFGSLESDVRCLDETGVDELGLHV